MSRLLCLVCLALSLAAIPAGPLAAQDKTYLQRFLEEVKKKIPPLEVPPPAPADFAAAPARKTTPLSMDEARALMGVTGTRSAERLPGGKLAIIDLGFSGLAEWLAAHPEEKRLTTLLSADQAQIGQGIPVPRFNEDPTFKNTGESDHGYHVYRVTRAVLPDVPILLYRAPTATDIGLSMLDAGNVRGSVLFNVSLGVDSLFDVFSAGEDALAKQLRVYLPQSEAFAIFSIGNSRGAIHAWTSRDADGDGTVDVRAATPARADAESLRVFLRKGPNTVRFAWDSRVAGADYELQLFGPSGVLAAARNDPAQRGPGWIELTYSAAQEGPGAIWIKRLGGPADGVFMRLDAYPIAVPGDYNGLQTAPSYAFRENPFVVFVGAFGRAEDGGLAPSGFSDIGRAADGKLVPHVLGPGELMLDGEPISGTSFAAPFITALYATRVGYNIKNLMERTASRGRLSPGVQAHETGRWGIPEADKIIADLKSITGPTRIEAVGHRVEGDDLIVNFAVTRCCMEGLTWYIGVTPTDPATKRPLAATVEATLRADTPDFVGHRVEVRLPGAAKALAGKVAEMAFSLRVRTWRDPPPGSLVIDEAPVYRATF